MGKKATITIWRLFAGGFCLWLIAVLAVCIADTQDNLPAAQMVVLPLCWLALAGAFCLLWERLAPVLEKRDTPALLVFLGVYGVVLYAVCMQIDAEPVNDEYFVIEGAKYLAGVSGDIYWEYFARCYNNRTAALYLSLLMQVHRLGLDPVKFAILTNVAQVLIAMYCLHWLFMRVQHSCFRAWASTLLCACCLPVICQTHALYTDSMSLVWGIAAFTCWVRAGETESRRNACAWRAAAGILWGIGTLIKATVVISLIAVLIYQILFGKREKVWRSMLPLLAALLVIGGTTMYLSRYPWTELTELYGTPKISYWLGIGLKGNGGYADNEDYSVQLKTLATMEEREAWSQEYIAENLYELWNPGHILSKTRYNFASGGFGSADFEQYTEDSGLLYELVMQNGRYYWRYCLITTSYFYFLLGSMAAACLVSLRSRDEGPDCVRTVALITMFGIMLYVMLFEANNRQLYNHLPWLVICAVSAFHPISGKRQGGKTR